jgi:RNA polymerase sigma factor (sigma-70 family)
VATVAATAATTSAAEVLDAPGRPDHEAAGARLSELFAWHGATVLGLCRVLLRHREEAEDAVQQTFLAAYGSLLNGNEPRHPAAWLATIARNECWGRIEKRMREPLTEREPESTLPDPVAAAAERADLGELWRAIGDLPRQQREALLLREFSGLSYVELSQALAVSEPAVESLLFRARRELRARLRPVYGSVGSVAPLEAIREALARVIGGMPDPSAAGTLAKIVSAPLLAKLAAGAAAVVVASGTVAVVESRPVRPGSASVDPSSRPVPKRDAAFVAPVRDPGAAPVLVAAKPGLGAHSPPARVTAPRGGGSSTDPIRPAPGAAPAVSGDPAENAPAGDSGTAPAEKPSSSGGGDDSAGAGSDTGDSSSGSTLDVESGDDGSSTGSGDTSGGASGSGGSEDTAESSGSSGESGDSGSGSGAESSTNGGDGADDGG